MYATKLKKLKLCQNKCIRKIFFIGNYEMPQHTTTYCIYLKLIMFLN
jgi:hypothetical protein